MVQHFGQVFGRKLQKLPPFGEKHEKSSIWPKLATFSSKLPCFRVWFNFSGKKMETMPHFAKSTKNHLLGQKFQVLEGNLGFRSTF